MGDPKYKEPAPKGKIKANSSEVTGKKKRGTVI